MLGREHGDLERLLLNRPGSIEQLVEGMSVEVVDSLRLAVEIGKWSDGKRLDAQQVELCMQAIILYESKHLPEQERVGFDLSASCKSKASTEQAQTISLVPGTGSADSEGSKV
ncbi:YeaC family protein [Gammaproteobacteria bacterium]|nr:YeaC family protein [Gammaproteobacteria bacterium]